MFKNTIVFLKNQTANIIVTVLGGLIPLIGNWVYTSFVKTSKNICFKALFEISPDKNYIFQSIFVLMTLYVLIQVRRFVVDDISNSDEQIKQYIRKNCGLKIYNREETSASAFRTVQETAHQFFYAWLVVWLMWLVYYGGGFLIYSNICPCDKAVLDIYQQVFDFLNSTALFAIYIIMTNVTVNRKERNHNEYDFLDSILAWAVLFIVFIAGIIVEINAPSHLLAKIMPFYVGAISTLTFVLLLGKLNSSYLKIPSLFMLFLYIYAIIQLYIPFKDFCLQNNCWLRQFLNYSLPHITLLGKFFLMLTICWIAVQRRFIFFVIHRSTTIDKIDDLISELNKEKVSF